MGEVYLAQHPRLPRRDALKVLPADVSADAEYRARFNREADLASTLYHPHIVGVHDRGEYEGHLWISMDFIDGQDAARLLASRFPAGMPTDHVVRIVTTVAGALDYAHKQGLLHRDVKPANIMLTHLDDDGEQRILLADFGIARDIDDISGLTTTNMAVGTVAYSAPEQLMGEEIDGRADQYALAATAYHLLTGSQLFPHSNPAVVISRHLNSPPPALADTRPELAAPASTPCSERRSPRTPTTLRSLRGLRRRTGRASIARGSSSTAPTTPAPASRKAASPAREPAVRGVVGGSPKRWLIPAAVLGAVALVSAGALAWHPWQQRVPAPPPTSSSQPPAAASSTALPTSSAAPPPPPATATLAPSPPPISSTVTTTVPPTSVPAAAAQGLPCDPSDAAKLAYDVNTGKDIVCMNEGPLMHSGSPVWEWSETPLSMTGVHATGAPCDPQVDFWSRSTDGYLISCQLAQLGPTPGYWQHCGVRKRAEGYVCGP